MKNSFLFYKNTLNDVDSTFQRYPVGSCKKKRFVCAVEKRKEKKFKKKDSVGSECCKHKFEINERSLRNLQCAFERKSWESMILISHKLDWNKRGINAYDD